jgi:4-hydroxy-3-polyprenylbenzoate decarboxylase
MNAMYADLREWLAEVEAQGELKRINGAEWDLEMSAIAEVIFKEGKDTSPAVLFDQIPGYPEEYSTLMSILGSPFRIAKTLGLPEDQVDRPSLLTNWRKKVDKLTLIPPQKVNSVPVLANTDEGDQIDLFKFPAPKFHEKDGGRYIGTCDAVVQKDPEDGWVNVATYRAMVVDRNHLAFHPQHGKHGSIIMHKYFDRDQVMPVAIALGADPALFWSTSQPAVKWATSEYDYAGGIKGQPLEVFDGPQTGLPLPARAEIIIEGECHPGEFADEGPFGEWHGYYANLGLASLPEPMVRVKAIHYRDNPILSCANPSLPPSEFTLMYAISSSIGIWKRLQDAGLTGIENVWCHELGCGMLFNVIAIKQLYGGHSKQVGLIASQYPTEAGRYTVVVDEDIDPSNLEEVIWAIVTRVQPERSIQILPHCRSSNADPAIPLAEKVGASASHKPFTSSRVIIDACRDLSWKSDWYPMTRLSPKRHKEIFEKWQSQLADIIK